MSDAEFDAILTQYNDHMVRFAQGQRKAAPHIRDLLVELERREYWQKIAPSLSGVMDPPAFSSTPA